MTQTDPANAPEPRKKENVLVQLARYSQLAFTLPACTFAGLVLGYLLDKWLHTNWLYILGLLLGIAAGFVELIRTVTRSEGKQ
ncbi:MAG: AtpZ/AtpI family protein [Terriglobales bacterium]